jgi:dihydrolipoamide dehydrogenase
MIWGTWELRVNLKYFTIPQFILDKIVSGVSLDLEKMMKAKEQRVSGLTSGIEYLFKKNKVTYVKGKGTIVGPNEVKVACMDGTSQNLTSKNILIATGSDILSVPNIKVKKLIDI